MNASVNNSGELAKREFSFKNLFKLLAIASAPRLVERAEPVYRKLRCSIGLHADQYIIMKYSLIHKCMHCHKHFAEKPLTTNVTRFGRLSDIRRR